MSVLSSESPVSTRHGPGFTVKEPSYLFCYLFAALSVSVSTGGTWQEPDEAGARATAILCMGEGVEDHRG